MVVGDVDSHLFIDGGLVCGVGGGECRGDVPEAGHQGFDVVFGELGGGVVAEDSFEALTFLSSVSDPPSYGWSCFGFGADDAAVALEFVVEFGDPFPDLVASGLVVGIRTPEEGPSDEPSTTNPASPAPTNACVAGRQRDRAQNPVNTTRTRNKLPDVYM